MYNVALVDDHQLVSNSIKKLLESFGNIVIVTQLANGKELIEYLQNKSNELDLIVLDVKMPILDGKQTIKILKDEHPSLKVLVLSMDEDEETILHMIKFGARGYILKDADPQDFQIAIRSVIENGYYHSELMSKAMIHRIQKKNLVSFSDREMDFLQLCCSELTYKEIASKMFLSPKTIDNYRDTLFKKLDVKSRTGLVLYAIKNNLVTV